MLFDEARDFSQIMRPETMIHSQAHGQHPKFGIKTSFCNVNMWRLIALFRIKIKLVAVNSQHGWHGESKFLEI